MTAFDPSALLAVHRQVVGATRMDATPADQADAGADQADPQPDTRSDTPAEGPDAGKDWQAEAAKWKALARKHEASAKADAAKARRLDELEDAAKTEAQRQADALTAVTAERDAALAEAARLRLAARYGLDADDLDLARHRRGRGRAVPPTVGADRSPRPRYGATPPVRSLSVADSDRTGGPMGQVMAVADLSAPPVGGIAS